MGPVLTLSPAVAVAAAVAGRHQVVEAEAAAERRLVGAVEVVAAPRPTASALSA